MTYRPYPNADRARHQIGRHDDETPPLGEPRPLSPFEQQLARNAQEILKAAQPTLALAGARLRAAFQERLVSGEEASG